MGGCLASATMTYDQLRDAVREVKARTDRTFGVNLRADAEDADARVALHVDEGVRVAVAAFGMRANVGALGIDVDPAECLPSELLDLVATPQERLKLGDDPYRGRLLFVAKEAVYKAVHPLDQIFLEHHDVEINLAERKAVVRNGRVVELRLSTSAHHLVALAFLRARP